MRDKASLSLRLVLATFVVLSICAGSALAATEKILHSFNGMPHGAGPESALVSDASGNLYGTTIGGGTYSMGTVFELTPNSNGGWKQTVLYGFKGGSDGANPTASVVFDALGNLVRHDRVRRNRPVRSFVLCRLRHSFQAVAQLRRGMDRERALSVPERG
jgi:uncharacterized repeat protein (TIGR03803 family)